MRYKPLRDFLSNNSKIEEILEKGDKVFHNVQMPTAITTLIKIKIEGQNWNRFIVGNDLIEKINLNSTVIQDISKIMRGLEIGKDKVLDEFNDIQFITGEDIYRYGIKNYSFIDTLTYESYKKDNFYFKGNRIIIRETGNRITTIFIDDDITQQNRSLYSIKITNENDFKPLYILAILNSKIIQYYYQKKYTANTDIFPKIRIGQVKELPIKNIPILKQQPFIDYAKVMLLNNKELQTKSETFVKRIKSSFSNVKITTKLSNFYEYDFKTFVSELKKQKNEISLKHQDEWEEYFDSYKKEINELQSQINQTDKEIDNLVYKLYELTEEEIKIVEQAK